MSRVERSARVKLDMLQHFLFIGEDNLDAANRFFDAVEEAFLKLADMPGMGRLRGFRKPESADIRSWPVKGFRNYLIFYRPIPGGIKVLRVVHGARDIGAVFDDTPEGDASV